MTVRIAVKIAMRAATHLHPPASPKNPPTCIVSKEGITTWGISSEGDKHSRLVQEQDPKMALKQTRPFPNPSVRH